MIKENRPRRNEAMSNILGIFTCYNRKEKTLRCLNSLLNGNPGITFSFIAVDDNSTDGTGEALSLFQNIRIISGNGQSFYSGGMRLGIAEGKKCCGHYDRVLLFNDDVDFFPHCIEQLEAFAVNDREIITGATCDEKGLLTYGGVQKASRFKPEFRIVMSRNNRVRCDTFNANCVLLPPEIFRRLPNIDEHYTHSMGDFDYGLEAAKRGIPITASDFFVGTCSDNPIDGTWRDPRLPRRERLKRKESPKGLPGREWFYFVKKHFGIFSACLSSITPYIKILTGMS